jgi:hypothetical protein
MAHAQAFVDGWHRAWRDRDGHAYAELLHEDCVQYPTGVSYFDPRPLLERQQPPTAQ